MHQFFYIYTNTKFEICKKVDYDYYRFAITSSFNILARVGKQHPFWTSVLYAKHQKFFT